MIQIFDIKRKKNLKENGNDSILKYKELATQDSVQLVHNLNSSITGLTDKEAIERLMRDGYNRVVKDDKKSWFYFLLLSFKDQFIFILIILACINLFLGDKLGSGIIF